MRSGLKRVLGRELITNDDVAIFELVKNSFDAEAGEVFLFFDRGRIVIADNGFGMSYADVIEKWFSVAYSSKRQTEHDYRDIAASRTHFAGSKGIGRFSSDRLGSRLILQTKPKANLADSVHRLDIDWVQFETDERARFEDIPVTYTSADAFDLPGELIEFAGGFDHGTVLEIRGLRQEWDREALQRLKASLAKLINPFGSETDNFSITIVAPTELAEDNRVREKYSAKGEQPSAREIVNGKVGNFIFSALREKTTFISVRVEGGKIHTSLTDRGELVYSIREPNRDYPELEGAGVRCDIYYLNQSARVTFARRVGLPSVKFGSVFVFRNGFRIYPIGEETDDWFGFNRRKQQGHSRYLGGREVIGRVDIVGEETRFQEASSRNQGLIETPAVVQLKTFVDFHCLRRLERYVVPVSWADQGEANSEDISRLLTDPGKARVSMAVANLVDSEDIELIEFSRNLISVLNERAADFEASIASLRAIAEKAEDKSFLAKISTAELRYDELRKSEAEARRIADEERRIALAATARADIAELVAEEAQERAETEMRRSHFLESVVALDAATILTLHHQVALYSINAAQRIENFLVETANQEMVPREVVLAELERISFLNSKIYAVAKFAARATFKLDSEKIDSDLPKFVADYISEIAKQYSSARQRIEIENDHPGMRATFKPIDISIIVDNLISNSYKASSSRVSFKITALGKAGVQILVSDNGKGFRAGVDVGRIFEMGYTTAPNSGAPGSGLGLYHVRQMLGEMGGTIEVVEAVNGRGVTFLIKIFPGNKKK